MFHFLSKMRAKADSNALIENCLVVMIYSRNFGLVLKPEPSESLTRFRSLFIGYFSIDFKGCYLDSQSALFCI